MKLSDTEIKFRYLVREYNKYAKAKYQRTLWRNLRPDEFVHYQSLQNTLLGWANKHKRITYAQRRELEALLREKQVSNSIKKTIIKKFKRHDLDEIVATLLNGYLVVIPNDKIYVIFGVDDEQSTLRITKKINLEKLRHPLMPVVKLSFLDTIPYENVDDKNVKDFLCLLVQRFHPIGLLLPDRPRGKKSLYVFYGDRFFKDLREELYTNAQKNISIYVSSANITTTGANTTAEGVQSDFSQSKFIMGILDEGDLRTKSAKADSSTIIECSESGELTYYRIGYPPQEQISYFANSLGYEIKELPNTRYTFSR